MSNVVFRTSPGIQVARTAYIADDEIEKVASAFVAKAGKVPLFEESKTKKCKHDFASWRHNLCDLDRAGVTDAWQMVFEYIKRFQEPERTTVTTKVRRFIIAGSMHPTVLGTGKSTNLGRQIKDFVEDGKKNRTATFGTVSNLILGLLALLQICVEHTGNSAMREAITCSRENRNLFRTLVASFEIIGSDHKCIKNITRSDWLNRQSGRTILDIVYAALHALSVKDIMNMSSIDCVEDQPTPSVSSEASQADAISDHNGSDVVTDVDEPDSDFPDASSSDLEPGSKNSGARASDVFPESSLRKLFEVTTAEMSESALKGVCKCFDKACSIGQNHGLTTEQQQHVKQFLTGRDGCSDFDFLSSCDMSQATGWIVRENSIDGESFQNETDADLNVEYLFVPWKNVSSVFLGYLCRKAQGYAPYHAKRKGLRIRDLPPQIEYAVGRFCITYERELTAITNIDDENIRINHWSYPSTTSKVATKILCKKEVFQTQDWTSALTHQTRTSFWCKCALCDFAPKASDILSCKCPPPRFDVSGANKFDSVRRAIGANNGLYMGLGSHSFWDDTREKLLTASVMQQNLVCCLPENQFVPLFDEIMSSRYDTYSGVVHTS